MRAQWRRQLPARCQIVRPSNRMLRHVSLIRCAPRQFMLCDDNGKRGKSTTSALLPSLSSVR
jgi:hypothetical protein